MRSAGRQALVPLFVAALAVSAASGAQTSTLPFRLGLAVDFGAGGGPESWREEVELSALRYLRSRGCYASVSVHDEDAPGETDLLLRVRIRDVEEEQRYDIASSELYDPDRPPDTENRFTLEFRSRFDLRLEKWPEGATVRRRDMQLETTYRPRMDEDPRFEVRRDMLDHVNRALKALACKGSEKKLRREIDAALAAR